jgi:ABC-type phosphate/phosphonate transport system permease subunit
MLLQWFRTSFRFSQTFFITQVCAFFFDLFPSFLREKISKNIRSVSHTFFSYFTPDIKVVERTCLCFARLVDAFQKNTSALLSIASCGMEAHLLGLLSASNSVQSGTFKMVLRTLTSLVRRCPPLAFSLVESGAVPCLTSLMAVASSAALGQLW